MSLRMPNDQEMIRQFMLDRMEFHYNQHLNLHIRERDNVRFFEYLDQTMYSLVFGLAASLAKGEIVDETKTVTCTFKFNIFTSWVDHLKFRLNKKFPRLKLKINYTQMVKTQDVTVPVKSTRVCPHINIPFGNNPNIHVGWLLPLQTRGL